MKYFIILASASIILLYGACKISTANTKIENSISPDTFRLKGAAVMAFYEPYTIHKLYVIGGVYTPNGDTLATLQAKNDVSFEAKISMEKFLRYDSVYLSLTSGFMGRSVRMPISTKNYKNNDSITVFLQPACSCEFKEIEKYGDDMIRNLGSSWDGVYPYPCIIDWNGESHNFYRAASEVKKAIENVEKRRKQ